MKLSLLDRAASRRFIEQALQEDVGDGDITTNLLIPEDATAELVFRSREPLVIAGLSLVPLVFSCIDVEFRAESHVQDGDWLPEPATLMTIKGNARTLLTGERVALNLLQRLSGVATLTRRYVASVSGTGARILDTRKTMPGMRMLDKYAVRCGGGENHRMRLDDAILIKDNHLAVCGGITRAVALAKAGNMQGLKIEVECDTLDQVREAAAAGADWILCDNMSPALLREAVAINRGQVKLEASGGVTLETVRDIAATGVDAISVGALTHSAPAVDIGLDVAVSA